MRVQLKVLFIKHAAIVLVIATSVDLLRVDDAGSIHTEASTSLAASSALIDLAGF